MTQTYSYQGVNHRQVNITGELNADSLSHARTLLRQRRIRTTKLKKKTAPFYTGVLTKRIKPSDVSFASRQMATMISAGIPIVQCLNTIGLGHNNKAMQHMLLSIANDLEEGIAFSAALDKHPKQFNTLFTSLVAAGEQSGTLDIMLNRIATYNEKLESIKSRIKSALSYPVVVLLISAIVIGLLLFYVIPVFEELFQGVGADLPMLTQFLISVSAWLQSHWFMLFSSVSLSIILLLISHNKSARLQLLADKSCLHLPVLGSILRKSALARFARTLAIMFGAGVPIVDAMNTVGAATGNRLYQQATKDIKSDISAGRNLSSAMAVSQHFPNILLQMVATGEESGELEVMLIKIAEFYEQQVDDTVDALSSLIEPILIVVLGVIIGTMVLAMYMPIFKMASVF